MGWLRSSGRSEVGVDRAEALVGVRGVRELLSHYDIDPLHRITLLTNNTIDKCRIY